MRHTIVPKTSGPREWDPRNPDPELPRDMPYFAKVLVELEKHAPDEDIHCIVTWDQDALPEYGPNVIVIHIGDEVGLMPRYARHVRMVARVMSRYPYLGINHWWPLSRLKILLAIKYLRGWILHFGSWLRYKFPPSSWPKRVCDQPNIVHLPWGSAPLLEVPMKKMSERNRNYFFSGGIKVGVAIGYRKYIAPPKIIARQAMVRAVGNLEKKYPSLAPSQMVVVHSDKSTGFLTDGIEYAQRLMDAKVCLAPRGSAADTWRFFEGLKSGCAVITNPLPDEWYYHDAPVLQIDDWRELEETIIPLLADDSRLDEMHEKSMNYWEEVCGEKAVGRRLASALSGSK